ncbi:MAG: hypothetical protein ACT4N2_03625 [Hyphomicrobium sp.]
MKLRSNLPAVATGLVTSILLATAATSASAACKGHSHTASGSASGIQYLASVSAKNAWKSTVGGHDGGAYDSWYKASNKSVTCKKGGPGALWTCTAKAKPCS